MDVHLWEILLAEEKQVRTGQHCTFTLWSGQLAPLKKKNLAMLAKYIKHMTGEKPLRLFSSFKHSSCVKQTSSSNPTCGKHRSAYWQRHGSICSEVLRVSFFSLCSSKTWSVYGVLVAIYTVFVELWSVPCGLEGRAVPLDGWGSELQGICAILDFKTELVSPFYLSEITTEIKHKADTWNKSTARRATLWDYYAHGDV